MTAKEWLSRARELRVRIDALKKSKQKAYERATASTVAMGPEFSGRASGHRPDDRIAHHASLSLELDKQLEQLNQVLAEIMDVISQIENDTLASILIEYYINRSSWEETAEVIGYSSRHIARLHREALNEVRKITGLE